MHEVSEKLYPARWVALVAFMLVNVSVQVL